MLEITKNNLTLNSSYEKIPNKFTSSGDIIIPDSKPDVQNVLYVDVIPIIEDTSINSEQLTLTGNVEFNVIYSSLEENSRIIRISTLIPFKNSFEVPNLTSDSKFNISIYANSSESNILNERKISLKSNINVCISFFNERKIEFINNVPENNEIKTLCDTKTLPIVISADSIKTNISDSSIISSSLPNIEEIIKYDAKIINEEAVASDNKVMFKGELVITVFYTSTDKKICSFEYTIPYSNFLNNCEIPENSYFDLNSNINNLSIKVCPDTDELMRVLEYKASICTYICILQSKNINVISDIYSINHTLTPKFESIYYSNISPRKQENISFRGVINIPSSDNMEILTTIGKLKDINIIEENSTSTLSGNIEITVIYRNNSSNNIETSSVDMPINHMLSSMINSISSINLLNIECTQIDGGKCDIKLSLNINGNIMDINKVNLIIDIDESENLENKNKGIIIYYPKQNDTLWNIAKKYGTTVDKLRVINNLSENSHITIGTPLVIC